MIALTQLENLERILASRRKDKQARYVALDVVRQVIRTEKANAAQSARQPRSQFRNAATQRPYITPEMRAKIDVFLANGKKIQAIKEYRIATSLGFKEAKETIESRTY